MNGWGQDKLILQLMGEIRLAKYKLNEVGEYVKPKSFINVGSSKGLLILAYVYLRQTDEPDDYLRRSEVAQLFWEEFEKKAQNNNLRGVINKVNKVFIEEYGFPIFEKGANRQANSFLRLVDDFADYLELDVLILENAILENKTQIVKQFVNKKFCASCPLDPSNESLGFWLDDQRLKYQQLLKQFNPQTQNKSDYLDPKVSASSILRKLDLDNPGEEIIEFYLNRKQRTNYPKELSFRRERDLEAILNFCKEHFRGLQNHLQNFRSGKGLEPNQYENTNRRLLADDMFEIFLAVSILGKNAPIGENSAILNSFFYQALDNYYEVEESHRDIYHAILQELRYDGWLESDADSQHLSVISQEFAQDIIKKNSLVAIELAKILLEQYTNIYPNAEQYQQSLSGIFENIPFSEVEQEYYPILAKHVELKSLNLKYLDKYGKIVDELSVFFENMRGAQFDIRKANNYMELLWLYLLSLERVSDYSSMTKVFAELGQSDDTDVIFEYLSANTKNLKILALFLKYCYRLGKISELQKYLITVDNSFSDSLQADSWAESLIHNVRGSLSWEVFGRSNYYRALHHFQIFKSQISKLSGYESDGEKLSEDLRKMFESSFVSKTWLDVIAETALTKSLGVMDRSSYKEAAKHCDELSVSWRKLAADYPIIASLHTAIGEASDEELSKLAEKLNKMLKDNDVSPELGQLTLDSMKASRYWEISKTYYDDALEWFEMALVGWSDLSEKHMQLGNLQNMAAVFGDMRDFEKAQEYFDEALELCDKDSRMKLQELRIMFNSGYMYQNYIGDYPNYSQSCIDEAMGKYKQCDQLVSDLVLRGHEIPKEFLVQFYSNRGLLGLDILRKDGHNLSEAAKTEQELKDRRAVLADFEQAFNNAQEIGKEEMVLRTKIFVLLLKAIESRRLRLVSKKIEEFNKKGYRDATIMAMFELFFTQAGEAN